VQIGGVFSFRRYNRTEVDYIRYIYLLSTFRLRGVILPLPRLKSRILPPTNR
jgi:hypothetical protein